MSLTRKMLKAMSIEADAIDQIIEAHTETVDALKADRDRYKAEADKVPELEKDLADARKAAEGAADDAKYKEKYEAEKQAFTDYKSKIDAEVDKAKKITAYKALLKKAGVSDKRMDSVLKVTSMDDIELDADGNVKNAEGIEKSIKEEWADFIVETHDEGAGTETPPSGAGAGGKVLSRAAQVVAAHNARLYGVKGEETK